MAQRTRKIARSTPDLAKSLNVARATAYRWVRSGCPRLDDGTFDVDQVAAWVRVMRRNARGKKSTDAATTTGVAVDPVDDLGTGFSAREKAEIEVALKKVTLATKHLEYQVAQGSKIDRSEVKRLLDRRMMMFGRALRAAGRRLAPQLVNIPDVAEIQSMIDEEMTAILWDCYGKAPKHLAEENGDESPA